jgi:gliding motility-associated protein GldM
MSTGKETPRQRMIGMMYLVLTALLALQVSSAIIEKFYALNQSMETTINNGIQYNTDRLAIIKKAVANRGNSAADKQTQTQAEELRTKTESVVSFMNKLKTEMIVKTGGYDEDGNLKGAKEETEVEVYMLGTNKLNGKAYELQNKLNEYIVFVNKSSGMNFSKLALDAKDDPMYQNNADQKNKDFAQLNFAQTPLVAAMAVVSDLQTKVTNIESTLMNQYLATLGQDDFMVDNMIPIVRAKSKYVPAGTTYEAEVLMAASSSSLAPTMQVGTQVLTVNKEGIGSYNFKAGGGAYSADGLLKKTWTAQIKIKKPNGKDTLYTVSEDYFVVKPVIQIQSAAQTGLYFNCGNKVDIMVPALGAEYNPEFKATGATVKSTGTKGRVYIIPNAASTKIAVYNKGQFIGDENFNVKAIPKPTIEVRVNGQLINARTGISHMALKNISIKAIPDADFAASQPEDAMYKVTEWEIDFGRGRRPVPGLPKMTPSDQLVSMSGKAQNLQDKDMIFVTPKKIMRKNYLGTWEEVKVASTPILIPILEN